MIEKYCEADPFDPRLLPFIRYSHPNHMDEKFSDLDKETAEHLSSILEAQAQTSFNAIVETDKWLTQYNFLVNSGGAAAVLSYLSSEPTPTFAFVPLTIFLVGVIASGFEIRYLLKIHSELHQDAIRRRSGFVSNKFSDHQEPKWPGSVCFEEPCYPQQRRFAAHLVRAKKLSVVLKLPAAFLRQFLPASRKLPAPLPSVISVPG